VEGLRRTTMGSSTTITTTIAEAIPIITTRTTIKNILKVHYKISTVNTTRVDGIGGTITGLITCPITNNYPSLAVNTTTARKAHHLKMNR
jgi:spore germination protein GerM